MTKLSKINATMGIYDINTSEENYIVNLNQN